MSAVLLAAFEIADLAKSVGRVVTFPTSIREVLG
jgi:hypothetical protein